MALSNTAVPKIYGKFRESVIKGEIPVCETISMEMNRIDALIKNPGVYYDDKAINGYIDYCEKELVLTDGSDMFLLDTFKLWAEQALSWYYYEERSVFQPNKNGRGGRYVKKKIKKRLTRKQYIILPRGGAKSMYSSTFHNYFLNCVPTATNQVVVAPTMRQAEETISPIKLSISLARGPLFKFLTSGSINNTTGSKLNKVKLASTKKGIQNFINGSIIEVRPLSIDKLQGLRVALATIDEWLSCDIREDPIDTIEQGCSKSQSGGTNSDDYLILAISSEGTVRNGIGDTIKMDLMNILKGIYNDPHTSIWWYKLDDIHEISDPSKWIKAQPNIGKTVTYETYQRDVERAEANPSARNDIIAKRFNIPMEGYTYFFTYDEIQMHRKRDFWGMPCSVGMDASQGDDFFAFTFLFPLKDGRFGIKCRSYITESTLAELPLATRIKYEEFINEGSLFIFPGIVLEPMQIYEDLDNFIIKSQYDVRAFGYDPYNAKEFVERYGLENGENGIEKVIQGSRTESVPLGELKKMAQNRMLLFDQEIMTFTMGNAIVLEDTNGNRKLYKKRYEQKIDNVSAMMDAYVAYKMHTEEFE